MQCVHNEIRCQKYCKHVYWLFCSLSKMFVKSLLKLYIKEFFFNFYIDEFVRPFMLNDKILLSH